MPKVTVPSYMKNFSCIGDSCEYTCCKNWNINMQQDTFNLLKNISDKEIAKVVENNISVTENNLYSIEVLENGNCPFLDSNKLCNIHKKAGAEKLSRICNTYPRVVNEINGKYETFASFSCPEVVRKSLFTDDSLVLQEGGVEFSRNTNIKNSIETVKANGWHKYFEKIRGFTCEILEYSNLKLEDKLLFMGLFFQSAQKKIESNSVSSIVSDISSFKSMLNNNEARGLSSKSQRNIEFQLNLIISLNQIKENAIFNNEVLEDEYKNYMSFLKNSYQIDKEDLDISHYENIQRKIVGKYIYKNETIFNNYLKNNILKNLFPISKNNNVFEEYCLLIIKFLLLKFYIGGYTSETKKISKNNLVEAITKFSRFIEHDNNYIDTIRVFLNNNNLLQLPIIGTLLRT